MVLHRDNGDCDNGSRLPRSINATSCYIRLIRVVGSEVADIWTLVSVGLGLDGALQVCTGGRGKRAIKVRAAKSFQACRRTAGTRFTWVRT